MKGKSKSALFFALWLFFAGWQGLLLAQTLQLNPEKTEGLIGDQIRLSFIAELPATAVLQWPLWLDTLGNLELLRAEKIDTLDKGNQKIYRQNLVVTAFDSGFYIVPPVAAMLSKTVEEQPELLRTEAFLLTYNLVEVDTAAPIKPIKDPVPVPLTFREVAPWLAGGAGLILLALLLFVLWRRRKLMPKKEKAEIIRPAHLIAIEKLKTTEEKKLWQQGEIKAYYSEVTDALREYLENRYRIDAMEYTTDEIMTRIRHIHMFKEEKRKLEEMLRLADLVKFAKEKPLPDENIQLMDKARSFVHATREDLLESDPEKGGANG